MLEAAGFVVEHVTTIVEIAALAGSWEVVICDGANARILLDAHPTLAIIVLEEAIESAAGIELLRRGVRDVISTPHALLLAIERHTRDLRERAVRRRTVIDELGHELNSPLAALVLSVELIGEEVAMLGHIKMPSGPGRNRDLETLVADAARSSAKLCEVLAAMREPKPGEDDDHKAAVRRGRILIVDDEPVLARALSRILGAHDVTVASDGQVALSKIERGDRFDVILCDLVMPNMTGMELHAALVRTAPEMTSRVAFMTGGAPTDHARDFLASVENPCLYKPFQAAQVRSLIARLLAQG